MRMNINHATKAGVTVHEYKVLEKRAPALEAEFDRITNEWLEGKKSGMLQFTMGTVGLENPMDKRYFYAVNADGKMIAFIVFVPFLRKNGYMADVTKHGKDAPGGVMETIFMMPSRSLKRMALATAVSDLLRLPVLILTVKIHLYMMIEFLHKAGL